MRRGIFSGSMTEAVRAVEREFELFKYKTLSKSREEIFEDCDRIRFYSCIHEYFLYAENMKDGHLKACLKCEDITGTLYRLYMKHEYLRYSRWEDIEELLNALAREQEDGKTGRWLAERSRQMGSLEELIDNEFSAGMIGILNYGLDEIGALLLDCMNAGRCEEMEDRISEMLADISKEFFAQGFLRGIAAARCGAV